MSQSIVRRSPSKASRRSSLQLSLPKGRIDKRVQEVGPERFGIASVDCAKHRSKWTLRNFFGKVLQEPQTVEHNEPALRAMIAALRGAVDRYHLAHVLVAIERTGNYHRIVYRACRDAEFETRLVHPLASQHFREAENPQNKTDDNDLGGIHRAAVLGFGLVEQQLDQTYSRLRLLVRHRRDLVWKMSSVQCQIREHLQATLPGLTTLFADKQFWTSPLPMALARRFASPHAIRELGRVQLAKLLRDERLHFQERTIDKIVAWSEQAAPPDPDASIEQRIICDLDDDRLEKLRMIHSLEIEIASLVGHTPYVLLMVIPGINVVSAADFAGEAGPIEHYANPNALTGRAGLFPSRYQSDTVDRQGRMVRCANRRLRAALMQIADNLIVVNNHFRGVAALWKQQRAHPGLQRVRVAKRFTRLAYSMLVGRKIIPHPCCREPHYILEKLLAFLLDHRATHTLMQQCLDRAAQQLPAAVRPAEAKQLQVQVNKLQNSRKTEARSLSTILQEVLAKRLIPRVDSPAEG